MGIRETVTQLYDDYSARELGKVLAALPENFCFQWPYDPATARYSGISHNKADLMTQLGDLDNNFVFNDYRATSITVDGPYATAQIKLDLTSKKTKRTFSAMIAHFWTFEGNTPVHLVEYMDTALMASESYSKTETTPSVQRETR